MEPRGAYGVGAHLSGKKGGLMEEVHGLDEVVGLVGRIYTRHGLSPPFHFRDAAQHWVGEDERGMMDRAAAGFMCCSRCRSGRSSTSPRSCRIRRPTRRAEPLFLSRTTTIMLLHGAAN